MDALFAARRQELLDECRVAPDIFEQVLPRLKEFMVPFVASLCRKEQVEHAETFVQGLLSDLVRKNVESIAYRFGQDRLPLQWFVGVSKWDDGLLRTELVRQVGEQLGEADGVLVFDPSAHPKSGNQSVGVGRQWCGRLGKVDNCQVGVYLGYVSREGHALVDTRLYLPEEWTQDKPRCEKAGVPKDCLRHRTRHELSLEMLDEHGPHLPHLWITGDDEMGRSTGFRRQLHARDEQYLLAIPSNTLIRDQESEEPEYSGRGRKPYRPWRRVDHWVSALPETAWTEIEVRNGSKGPLVVQTVKLRVKARMSTRKEGHDEVLVVIRYHDRDNERVVKTDYYLSNAAPETTLSEFARVANAEHKIEECIQQSKSEAGLSDYEVRNWTGWHHHQTLSMIATWFLVTETRCGKKKDAGHYPATNPRRHRTDPSCGQRLRCRRPHAPRTRATTHSQRTRTVLPLETT